LNKRKKLQKSNEKVLNKQYLKYQNKRPDYIDAFWNAVIREHVAKRYENALKSVCMK